MTSPVLPSAFMPYKQLDFCSNLLVDVVVPLIVGDFPVLLIGKGAISPMVWLAAPREPASPERIFILEASRPTNPAVDISLNAQKRSLRVTVSGAPVLEVQEIGPDRASVLLIDLSPVGLPVRGNASGLQIGGTQLSGNAFHGTFAAFAFAPPASTSEGAAISPTAVPHGA